jgi:hypothetical protein
MTVLVAGWFSFESMGTTAGDILARQVVTDWLRDAGIPFDVAAVEPFTGDVDWRTADPDAYAHVVFVCGPFGNGWPLSDFLERFAGRRLVGINISLLEPLDVWDPFDLLVERDSSRTTRPDLVFLSSVPPRPVVGRVEVHPQEEYGTRSEHDRAKDLLDGLLAAHDVAVVDIDTRLDHNATGLWSAGQVEAVIARMDVVVTTRLHGLVLALKNGVPVVALDPIQGGAKVLRQTEALDWPLRLTVDRATPEDLETAFARALEPRARLDAMGVAGRARQLLGDVRALLLEELTGGGGGGGAAARRG